MAKDRRKALPDTQMIRCDVPNGLLRKLNEIAPKYIQGDRYKSARTRWAIEAYLDIVAEEA